jgi:hypothetical protein
MADEFKLQLDQFKTEAQHAEMEQNQDHRLEIFQRTERE